MSALDERTTGPGAAETLQSAAAALTAFAGDPHHAAGIERVAALIAERLAAGSKVMACGNGGSACQAMHLCEELTGRFRRHRPALAAIACTDPGHLTCTANDFGFEQVFARWVEALGRTGDVLIVLSTSGDSPNVLAAVDAARQRGMVTVSLLGRGGGRLAGRCDHEWIVRHQQPERIQEVHMVVLHALVDRVESLLFAQGHGP